MPLSTTRVDSAKASEKAQKLSDGNGLYLFIPAASPATEVGAPRQVKRTTKSWRFDYRFGNKRFTLTFGIYPVIGLADARELLRLAKRQISDGINPALEKRAEKLTRQTALADTFSSIAKHWYDSKEKERSKAWKESSTLYLRRDLNPKIGNLPIRSIDRRLMLSTIEVAKVNRGIKTAERVRQTAAQVFDHAIRKMKVDSNPARLLVGWEDIPPPSNHPPLEFDEVHAFLDKVDAYPGYMSTKLCMKLLLLTFVRKTELTDAKWSEFDLDKGIWQIPATRMKMKDAHIVPISRQTLSVLVQLKPMSFGSEYLFPSNSTTDKPMSGATLNRAFNKMGYKGKFSPHGVRSTASTWLNSQKFRSDVIERQLAHAERNQIRAAYNHADYLGERTELMQAWADFVEPSPKI